MAYGTKITVEHVSAVIHVQYLSYVFFATEPVSSTLHESFVGLKYLRIFFSISGGY